MVSSNTSYCRGCAKAASSQKNLSWRRVVQDFCQHVTEIAEFQWVPFESTAWPFVSCLCCKCPFASLSQILMFVIIDSSCSVRYPVHVFVVRAKSQSDWSGQRARWQPSVSFLFQCQVGMVDDIGMPSKRNKSCLWKGRTIPCSSPPSPHSIPTGKG